MNHRFSSTKTILDILAQSDSLSATEISEKLRKSRVIIHRYLNSLVTDGKVKKVGTSPHTRYELSDKSLSFQNKIEQEEVYSSIQIPFREQKIIDEIFYKFSPTGKEYIWFDGFRKWCHEREYDMQKSLKNLISIYTHIQSLQDDCGLLPVTSNFWNEKDTLGIDRVFYADQYKWMEFGRGKLAEITFYAKQSQDKKLIQSAIDSILPRILCLISKEKIDAIGITPWSIERKNQLLWALRKSLSSNWYNFVNIIKYSESGIIIPQKSLKTREERIQNARNSIYIHDKNISSYKKVLLIDDFVGSWATLNETAKKLKIEGVQEVIGFAWVGNMNLSYDVINEI